MLLAAIVALVVGGGVARADERVVTSPRDVPFVMQPERLVLPPVPSDFRQADLGWLHVSYPASVQERVDPLLHDAEDVKKHLADELGQAVLAHVELRIARSPEQMQMLVPPELTLPKYASGVAYPPLHLVMLTLVDPLSSKAVDLDEVFRHELAHIALEDAVNGRHVPRWFNEGLAVFESGESSMDRSRVLWDASFSHTLLPLAELDRNFPSEQYEVNVAYAESADFVRFLLRNSDKARFTQLVERVRGGAAFDRAIEDSYGTDLRKLEYEWREELSKRYGYMPIISAALSLVWVGAIALLIVGWVRRRRQAKAKLAQWEREDEAMDRAIAAASVEREIPHVHEGVVARPNVPMVEHDGNWYTLH